MSTVPCLATFFYHEEKLRLSSDSNSRSCSDVLYDEASVIIETVKINRREGRNRAATGLTAFHEDETFRGRGIGSLNRSADEKIPAYA